MTPEDPRFDADLEEELAEQSGDRGSARWWTIGVVGVVLMSAVVVWLALMGSGDRVHWSDSGFLVHDDTRIEVRFDVTRDPDRPVTCRLEAMDYSKLLIGSTQVQIDPAESSPSRHVADVRTVARATTGYVHSCWYTDEDPPQDD